MCSNKPDPQKPKLCSQCVLIPDATIGHPQISCVYTQTYLLCSISDDTFVNQLLFPVVRFFFPHRKLLANQSASLQIIWQRSIYLLAKCVWGSINKSKYRENMLYSGLMEKKTWRIYCKYLCLFDRYFRINGMQQAVTTVCVLSCVLSFKVSYNLGYVKVLS